VILALESGGTKLVAAAANHRGNLLELTRRYRGEGQEAAETLAALCDMADQLCRSHGSVEAIGYGFGGTVRRPDAQPGPCFHEPGWDRVDAVSFLTEQLKAPVFIENDCNLGALAEAHFGVGCLKGTLLYATLGTGVGGGLVHNGMLFESGQLGEAEIGHIVVEPDGVPCACGNSGCLEAYCSGPGLAALATRLTGKNIDSRQLMLEYHAGVADTYPVIEQAAEYLARVFGAVINVLTPEVIVLGGGVMTDNLPFLNLIAARSDRYTFPFFRGGTRFCLSKLGENVICQGAAVYAIQKLNALQGKD
jgi:glucokinase